jgi:hypothetical protein
MLSELKIEVDMAKREPNKEAIELFPLPDGPPNRMIKLSFFWTMSLASW